MNPKVWIGTSWKMNKTLAEAEAFAGAMAEAEGSRDPRIQRFVIPPFTAVRQVKAALRETSVMVGAQNMHWSDAGAWTGEISPVMLTDCHLDMVELGHSERRAHFGETDETVALKTEAAVRHGLVPLICVGETREERESGRASEILDTQVRRVFAKLTDEQKAATMLLAYEPVWAIGDGGVPATSDYADARQAEINTVAEDVLGRRIPVLYGGSVNPDNCREFIQCPNIDGLFIGRSAWQVEGYLDILSRCGAVI